MATTVSRLSGERIVWLLIATVILCIVIWPLAISIDTAFHAEGRFGLLPGYSLAAVSSVYLGSEYLGLLGDSVRLAIWVTLLCTIAGVAIAVLMARTDLPGKPLLELLVVMPLFISPFTGLIAWVALGSAKTGFVNTLAATVFKATGIDAAPLVDIWTYGGAVWVMFLFFTPFIYLFTVGSLRTMDGTLEEAARVNGASALQAIIRVTLPLSMPSILIGALTVFILTAETYTIPGIIGSVAGFDVLAYRIFEDATGAPLKLAHAAAAATMLLVIAFFGMMLQRYITRSASRFVTVTGKGLRAEPMKLGKWKLPALLLISAYVVLTTILPLAALALFSFMRYSSGDLFGQPLSWVNYVQFFSGDDMRRALANTILLAFGAAAICVFAGAAISFMDVRRPGLATRTVAVLASIPVAVPGLVFGLGLLTVVLKSPLYGTVWVLLLAYVAKYVPFGVMMSRGGLQQLHPDLEHAARMSGANSLQTVWYITLPLMRFTLLSALFCIVVLCFKELSASVMLYTKNSEVLSVLAWNYMGSGNYQFAATLGVVQCLIIIILMVAIRALFGIRLERAMGKS
jgi:iron(III) transport system permease protein